MVWIVFVCFVPQHRAAFCKPWRLYPHAAHQRRARRPLDPPDARPGDRLYSMFQVVKNPADHWPLYSLIVSSIGLGIHFLTKLFRFLNRSSRPA